MIPWQKTLKGNAAQEVKKLSKMKFQLCDFSMSNKGKKGLEKAT